MLCRCASKVQTFALLDRVSLAAEGFPAQ